MKKIFLKNKVILIKLTEEQVEYTIKLSGQRGMRIFYLLFQPLKKLGGFGMMVGH